MDDLESVTPWVDEYLKDLKEDLQATDLIICLSAPTPEQWRLDVLPTYKGNRADVVRPELLQAVKDHMEHSYPSYRKPRLEADDIMGILSTHPTLVPGQKIIVSEDKDMKTIPGWLFNPGKDTKPRLIGEPEADYWHMYQTIVGDSTDGYKGAPGAGPKAAERVLRAKDGAYLTTKHMWQGVIEVFASKGLEEADALQQAQVARICRHTDYDFTNKRAVPWTPEEKA